MKARQINSHLSPVRDLVNRTPRHLKRIARDWMVDLRAHFDRAAEYCKMRKPDAADVCSRYRNTYWSEAIRCEKRHSIIRTSRPEDAGEIERVVCLADLNFAAARAFETLRDEVASKINPLQGDVGGTVDAALKPARVDPVERLHREWKIGDGHVRAADEIMWVVEQVTGSLGARAQALTTAGRLPKGSGVKEGSMAERAALLHAIVYVPWTKLCVHRGIDVEAVLDVVVLRRSVVQVGLMRRLSKDRMEALLLQALDLYGDVRSGADHSGELL